jgi:peptidoglycan-associated lipoprotein
MQAHNVVSLGTILLLLSACGGGTVPKPHSPATQTSQQPAAADSRSPTKSMVHIAADIREACGIAEADAHFAFDSAAVAESDRRALRQLAQCFVSGPLAGRDMRLVGHTDPRGDTEYNFVLGGRRADNVKGVLINQGLPTERVASSSRGELEADGVDEASWREDRRVDVLLAQ